MKILLILLGIIALLAIICVIRTLTVKPTAAKNASVPLENSPRAEEYGQRLAEMIRCETISSRYDPDRSKFYAFHDTLESLFPTFTPNVKSTCSTAACCSNGQAQEKPPPLCS